MEGGSGDTATMLFLKLDSNIYGSGLSNELLFITIAQEATKLWPIKVGGPKELPYAMPIYLPSKKLKLLVAS